MSKMKCSKVEWIGEIPMEWNINKLKNCAKEISSGGTPDSSNIEYYDDINGIPWVAIGDMSNNNIVKDTAKKITKNGLKSKKLNIYPKETLLYSIFATIGKTSLLNIDATINQAILAIIPNNLIHKIYLKYQLNAMEEYVIADCSTNTQSNLNSTKVKNFIIVLPKITEQKLISNFLDKKVDKLDEVLNDLSRQIEILNKYKKSIITEKVIGGLNSKVKYKNSDVEWIGNIPEHWQVKLIKNICNLKGRIGWEGLTKDEYISEGPILITGINFSNGNIDWDSCEHVSEWRFNQDKSIQIKNNDLLITKDGTVGKVALVSNCPNQVTLNSGVLLLRPIANNYVGKYLYYVLLSNEFWHWFDIENIGNTTITHLYQNRFGKFKLALPPIEEQKEIVEYLDKKCKQIDKIIEDKQKQIQNIEEYKKSVIYEYVTGKKRVEGAEELYG